MSQYQALKNRYLTNTIDIFNFDTAAEEFNQHFEIKEISGFEKINFLSKLIIKCINNRYFYLEVKVFNEYLIKTMARKYSRLAKCGRINIVLQNKKVTSLALFSE